MSASNNVTTSPPLTPAAIAGVVTDELELDDVVVGVTLSAMEVVVGVRLSAVKRGGARYDEVVILIMDVSMLLVVDGSVAIVETIIRNTMC